MRLQLLTPIILLLFASCNSVPKEFQSDLSPLKLTPDYMGVTIPFNIAPLNFRIGISAERYIVQFVSKHYQFDVHSSNGKIIIPKRKWKKLLSLNKGSTYSIQIFIKKDKNWIKYPELKNSISSEPIDPYVVYRLIEPGYELWNEMGIYQRCLEDFKESVIMTNKMSNNNCMNCHSFKTNDPHTMLFHMRGDNSGTYILKNNHLKRINLKTNNTISGGVYPAWYPDGSRIAFSTNKIIQFFHATPEKRVEVFDLESDIMIYNISDNTVMTPSALNDKNNLETFPVWSPDGKYLYYCCASKREINDYDIVKYSLLRRAYDHKTQEFGAPDTLFSALKNNKSVSFPRCSPDGKWLVITISDYGNFSIWHKSADLYSVNLASAKIKKLDLNSLQAESYHCWSSNGKWLIFSSRRDDGQYTRPYIAFFSNKTGNTTKPFVLPQRDPDFYNSFIKAFNLPELTKGKVLINPNDIVQSMKKEQLNARNSK